MEVYSADVRSKRSTAGSDTIRPGIARTSRSIGDCGRARSRMDLASGLRFGIAITSTGADSLRSAVTAKGSVTPLPNRPSKRVLSPPPAPPTSESRTRDAVSKSSTRRACERRSVTADGLVDRADCSHTILPRDTVAEFTVSQLILGGLAERGSDKSRCRYGATSWMAFL